MSTQKSSEAKNKLKTVLVIIGVLFPVIIWLDTIVFEAEVWQVWPASIIEMLLFLLGVLVGKTSYFKQ